MLSKHELRDQLLISRMARSQVQIDIACSSINVALLSILNSTTPNTLHYFEPIISMHEVNILSTISYLSVNYPKIAMVTTRKLGGLWRTIQTHGISAFELSEYDTVIVPMLGFDSLLHRIGYGSGFYDRLLSQQVKAQSIGVCFEAEHVQIIPAQAHDIPLDCIITEKMVRFG